MLHHASTYRRILAVSLDRVWENVLDWEHLPYLHASTFSTLELLERSTSPELWRARVGMRGVLAGQVVIELRTDRPSGSYVTRTLEGIGVGTEVRTRLERRGEHRTGIVVEFHLAGVPRLLVPIAGAGYKRLYHRLWDEDEVMMRHRQGVLDATAARRAARARDAVLAAPPPHSLGPLATLRARLPLHVTTPRGELRVIEVGGELVAHTTTCPHLGGPLRDAPVVDGCITCPWHGYRFDVRTGRPAGEHRCRLPKPPSVEVDAAGIARLVWAAAPDATEPDAPAT